MLAAGEPRITEIQRDAFDQAEQRLSWWDKKRGRVDKDNNDGLSAKDAFGTEYRLVNALRSVTLEGNVITPTYFLQMKHGSLWRYVPVRAFPSPETLFIIGSQSETSTEVYLKVFDGMGFTGNRCCANYWRYFKISISSEGVRR